MFNSKKKANPKNDDGSMGLVDHLAELRKRITVIILSALIGFVLCFTFASRLVNYVADMAIGFGYDLVYLAPTELFMQYIKVGILGAIVIMSPVILYEIWAFLSPGLTTNEKKALLPALFFGLFCFVVGAAFSYKIMLPFMLQFFFNVNTSSDIAASISVENYLNFILSAVLTFGITFELPVVIAILTQFGLVRPELLKKGRKIAIVLIFLVGALITPPDITSQIMVALPMIVLYQISILVSSVIDRKRKRKEEGEENG